MRQYWEAEEITEHWSLLPDEMLLLRNKSGNTRLGFAVGLKFFQMYGRFPRYTDNIPKSIVTYIAKQVDIIAIDAAIQYSITINLKGFVFK